MRTKGSRSAFDRNRDVEHRRRSCRLTLSLDGLFDDLLHVRATFATAQTGTGRARNVTCRVGAVSNEATNLSIGDPTAMAYEHRFSLSDSDSKRQSIHKENENQCHFQFGRRESLPRVGTIALTTPWGIHSRNVPPSNRAGDRPPSAPNDRFPYGMISLCPRYADRAQEKSCRRMIRPRSTFR